jgi:hypothetical protein
MDSCLARRDILSQLAPEKEEFGKYRGRVKQDSHKTNWRLTVPEKDRVK